MFVIGVGGVGGALLEQLKRQQSWLKNKHIDLRVCGVANSKALLTNVHGLNLENWQEELAQAKEPFNLGRLIRLVKEYHLLNPVIVDCTSSQAVADQYADFLREGFHVVTPNKKANTSSMDYYHQLRYAAEKSRRKFLYDTNVGAGLPVRVEFYSKENRTEGHFSCTTWIRICFAAVNGDAERFGFSANGVIQHASIGFTNSCSLQQDQTIFITAVNAGFTGVINNQTTDI